MSRARSNDRAAEPDVDLGSDKLHFKIGEVSEIVGVPPHVLRYWETEFRSIRPHKTRGQQRAYRRQDVAMLLKIKHLLYEEKFTIAGARRQLKEAPDECLAAPPSGLYLARRSLARLREQVREARAMVVQDTRPDAADPAAFVSEVGGAQGLLRRQRGRRGRGRTGP